MRRANKQVFRLGYLVYTRLVTSATPVIRANSKRIGHSVRQGLTMCWTHELGWPMLWSLFQSVSHSGT